MQSQLNQVVTDTNNGSSQLSGSSLTVEQIQTYNQLLNKFGSDFATAQNSLTQAQMNLANPSWSTICSDLQIVHMQLSTAQLDFENISTKFIPSIPHNTEAYILLNNMANKVTSNINQAQVTLLNILNPIQEYLSDQAKSNNTWFSWVVVAIIVTIFIVLPVVMIWRSSGQRTVVVREVAPMYRQPYYYDRPYDQPYYVDRPQPVVVVSNPRPYTPSPPVLAPIREQARASDFTPISPIRGII